MRKFRKLTQFLKKKPKIKKGGQKKGVNFPYIRKVIDPLSQAGLPLRSNTAHGRPSCDRGAVAEKTNCAS